MVLVLALSVALVGPFFVDWTSYRADFEREASRVMGREVTVKGAASARLLPLPSVTFHDVEVAGAHEGEPAMTIETFSMDAELAPFLRGEILIFDMRLVRPRAVVDIDDAGHFDWTLQPHVSPAVRRVSLESMTVTDGSVEFRHAASGRTHLVDDLNAQLSARSLSGPWRMQGSLRLDGIATNLSLSTGQAGDAAGLRVRMRAQPERYPVSLEADGRLQESEGVPAFLGEFRLNASGLEAARASGADERIDPLYRLMGQFDLDHRRLDLSEYRFETGPVDDPYIAEGSAQFDLGTSPRFLVRGDGAQVRLDETETQSGALHLGERLAGLRDFVRGLPRPTIPGRIEVRLPAIVAGDTTIREVELMAEPADGGWRLETLKAQLPGRTTLEVTGDLTTAGEFDFGGSLLLAVGQPSGFAAWVARDVDDAIRRLPAAGFSADVELSDERQSFRDLELVLGTARFRGEIDHRQPADARPSMSLRLEGERLDFEGMNAFASMFVNAEGVNRLDDHDLSFDIKAGPVSAMGLEAESIDTALRLGQDRLEIDRLAIGGLEGANISATGMIRDFGTAPTGNLDAALIAADLEPLVSMLASRFPDNWLVTRLNERARAYPGLLTDARFDIVASGAGGGADETGASLSASGEAGATRYRMSVSTRDTGAGWFDSPLSLSVSGENDEAGPILAMLGLPALPIDLAGPAAMSLDMEGSLAGGADTRFSLTGNGLDGELTGDVAMRDGGVRIDGQARLESDDLVPWLMASGAGLPEAAAGSSIPVALQGQLDYGRGLLVLGNLSGIVADVGIAGDINTQLRDGRPHVSGDLSAQMLDLALVAEMLLGPASLVPTDEDAWPDEPFRQSPDPPVTANLNLSSETLYVGNAARLSDARLGLRLESQAVEVTEFEAGLHGGRASGLFELRNEGGTGLFSGQLRLSDADLTALTGHPQVSGRADLSASLTSNGMSIEGMVAALAGSGNATVRDLVIDGINPNGLAAIMEGAERLGTDINADATALLAPDIVRDGAFAAETLELALSVAGGRVRAPPFRLRQDGARLAGELAADLRNLTVDANVRLTYDPGLDDLPGAEPSVAYVVRGPLEGPSVELDTAMLAQFLSQRALEREQARVEAMQASLLEQQRHRREARYYAALEQRRADAEETRLRMREEEIRRFAEQARLLAEQRERREAERAVEEERIEEERRLAEEEARILAEDEARQQAEELERASEEARLREENERLRAAVEALLEAQERERQAGEGDPERPVPDGDGIQRAPLPAPEPEAGDGTGAPAGQPAPGTGADIFAPDNLTIDGLLGSDGLGNFQEGP